LLRCRCFVLQRGLLDPEKEDPFSLFVASTSIRYCYYADTHKVLGSTYGMLVLQVNPCWGWYCGSAADKFGGDTACRSIV
jgi:hypothetical protein